MKNEVDNLEARLLEGGATDFERSLLNAAIEEAPTAELGAKMLAPLAVGGAATSAAGATLLAKWLGAGAAVLAVGGALYLSSGGTTEETRATVPNEAPVSSQTTDAPVPGPSREEVLDEAPPPSPLTAKEPEKPTARSVQATSVQKKSGSTLADEMRLLDRARAALKAQNAEEALRLLSLYDSKYPSGDLRPEATVLRVSALKESGEKDRATELKSEFLKEHPTSAHKKQLENGSSSAK